MSIPRQLVPLLVLLSLCASPAHAQQIENIEISVAPEAINIGNCDTATVVFTVEVNVLDGQINADSTYVFELGDVCVADSVTEPYVGCAPGAASCCEAVLDGAMAAGTPLSLETSVTLSEWIDCEGDPKVGNLVFHAKMDSLDTSANNAITFAQKTLVVDLSRPAAPALPGVSPGETTATVDWTAIDESGDIEYRACAFVGTYDADAPIGEQDLTDLHCSGLVSETEARIGGLAEQTTYVVVVSSVDAGGNESLPSEATTFQTQQVRDFYEVYREVGGAEAGGFCATAIGSSAGPWAMVLVIAMLLGLGRRRWFAGLFALLLFPSLAWSASPEMGTFEFRMGSWTPAIDAEFPRADEGPYANFFEEESMSVLHFEVVGYLLREYGTLAAGLGLGQSSVEAKGLTESGARSDEVASFTLFPISGIVSYAFDVPARRWNFPLVPYGKVGLDWVLWRIEDGSEETARTDEPKGQGSGATWGYHTSLGVRLLLDALAPEMARTFDIDVGVNNSYLFGEYISATIDDFGDKNSFRLGDETFLYGLAFDF